MITLPGLFMQLDAIQLFCDVAHHRSVSKGAELHGVTQSAASQRIRELERQIGTRLIDRSVRPLGLTAGGAVFYEGCCDMLRRFESLTSQVAKVGARDLVEGQVRVDAIYSAGIGLLNHLRAEFETQHPRVHITIEYKHPDDVYEAVRRHDCDLGILSYPRRWPGVAVVPLRDEPMAVISAPGHPLAARAVLMPADLDGLPMVAFEQELPAGRQVRRYLKEHGAAPRIETSFDNVDTIKAAVAVTDQIAIVPERTVQREVAAGQLACVRLEPTLLRPIGIIYRRGRGGQALGPGPEAFIAFLKKHAGPGEHESSDSSVGIGTRMAGG